MRDQCGRLLIPQSMYQDDLEIVQRIYSMLVPYRVELLYAQNAFEILAISQHFEPVPLGAEPFAYSVEHDKIKNTITFRRKE